MTQPPQERAVPTWLAENLARVRDEIATAADQAGRRADDVRLVAVTKTHPPALVVAAARLGLTELGENRVHEAAEKIPAVNAALETAPTWHMIGTVQTNEVKAALDLFAIIQSVDSLKLAEAIARRVERTPYPVLLEVYLGDDAERPGLRPAELLPTAERLAERAELDVRGLMTVAPLGLSERDTRACFARLRALRDDLARQFPRWDCHALSMGMSEDFRLAIAEGSTSVRLGRALFGERRSAPPSSC